MKYKKIALSALVSVLLVMTLISGCAKKEETPTAKTNINVAVLKGPTGIGAVKLMADNDEGKTTNNYSFTTASAPDEVVGKVVSGEIDIAAVPTNIAATLYNKTEGNVKIAALNTLGVLYLLENGNEINAIEDLSGKTVYSSGQGATPEYVLNYILESKGLNGVKVEYKSEHAEIATTMVSGDIKIGILPEPNVTPVIMKNQDVRIALDLTEEWENALKGTENEGSVLSMGCVIIRNDFLNENKEAVDKFLEEYKSSIEYVNTNIPESSVLVEKYGIMASAQSAEKAIPNCNIIYIDGNEMKDSIANFFNVLYTANPKSVGGKLPDEDFYYIK